MPFGVPTELLGIVVFSAIVLYVFRDEISDDWPVYAGAALLGFVLGWQMGGFPV